MDRGVGCLKNKKNIVLVRKSKHFSIFSLICVKENVDINDILLDIFLLLCRGDE